MTTTPRERLLAMLGRNDLPDYSPLNDAEAQKAVQPLLVELLEQAKAEWKQLLAVPAGGETWANTAEPTLHGDALLDELWGLANHANSADTKPVWEETIAAVQPLMVDYAMEKGMSKELYDKLLRVRDAGGLNPQQGAALGKLLEDLEDNGVHLPDATKERLRQIGQRLAALGEQLQQQVTAARAEWKLYITDEAVLGDMPATDKELAKKAAEADGRGDTWKFTQQIPSYTALMSYVTDSGLRRDAYQAKSRIAAAEPHDNRPLVLEVLQLRRELAEIYGCKDYAEYVLRRRMAEKPERVMQMYDELLPRVKEAAQRDLRELEALAGEPLHMWDMPYWDRKYTEKTLAINEEELSEYLPLEGVIDGMFAIAGRLYGLEFRQVAGAPSYHPDVRSYEVYRDGELMAHFLLDPYARPTQQSVAWASVLRGGWLRADGTRQLPVVLNMLSGAEPAGGRPSLLTYDDALTVLHEFGHGLHALLSHQDIANLNGFDIEWDMVELPSQMMERYLYHADGLALLARHWSTGKPLPEATVAALRRRYQLLKGTAYLRQMEFGLLDMHLHLGPVPADVPALHARALELARQVALLPRDDEYAQYASFMHVWGGGYAAGYYSYLWADILSADTFARFLQLGMLERATGKKFAAAIFDQGSSKPAAELYRQWAGGDADIKYFLEEAGL